MRSTLVWQWASGFEQLFLPASVYTVLPLLFISHRHFNGCPENIWVITLTLLGIMAMTGIQLSGHEGSLLTSGVMNLYAAYLAYSIVSKNQTVPASFGS